MEEKSKKYLAVLLVPVVLFVFSVSVLVNNYTQTGEWFSRSIDLKGGILININIPHPVDINDLEKKLSGMFGSVSIRELRGFGGYSISIELEPHVNTSTVLEEIEKNQIDVNGASVQTIGPSLGSVFWNQAQLGIMIAFIFMGIIVFVIFRTFIPSFAVIMAAVSDIIVTLACMQIFGIKLSLISFAALLMLIGYSIDTDILLTTRVLRGSGNITTRIRNGFKTGITMSLTTIGALVALFLSVISPVLSQIAAILLIGLSVDVINTWLMNATILRWYVERKGLED
jgi:preprotein translocase subunit SecF